RAGRKADTGNKKYAAQVVIQTQQPAHPVLQLVLKHDYPAMVAIELEGRKKFAYPPFSRLILLTFKHKHKEIVQKAAVVLADKLKTKYSRFMVGPAEPVINRIRNQYLMELLLKLPKDAALIKNCKTDILNAIAQLKQEKELKQVTVI